MAEWVTRNSRALWPRPNYHPNTADTQWVREGAREVWLLSYKKKKEKKAKCRLDSNRARFRQWSGLWSCRGKGLGEMFRHLSTPSSHHIFLHKPLPHLFLRLPLLKPYLLSSLFLFKQKLSGLERQQISLMGLMQMVSFLVFQNNRSWGPHVFQHEDIRMGSDRGQCWCSAKSYTLNTHTSY